MATGGNQDGGVAAAVRLGQWSRAFYLRQRHEIGTDSGFTEHGCR